jgi:cis-3-alkyl-4-acyloxetan-2-one decarboxylase
VISVKLRSSSPIDAVQRETPVMQTAQNIHGLQVTIEGEGPTLVFLHGWPDSPALWNDTVKALQDSHRCVRFALPGYDLSQPPRPVSVDEMCALIREVVDEVSPDEPVTLVLHDWGCFFGYEFAARNTARVARVVAADVGDTNSGAYLGRLKTQEKLMIAGYQLWLALAWKLGRWWPAMATGMTRFMARKIGCRTPSEHIAWQMNYPYAMQWLGSYGGLRGVARVDRTFGSVLPTLFIYGKRKPFMFHSERWLEHLRATPGCDAVGLDAGHWMMRQQPDAFNGTVKHWLEGDKAH